MTRKLVLLLVLLPALLAPLAAQHTHLTQSDLNRLRKANRLFNSGKVLFLEKKLDMAEVKLSETLKVWPEYSEAAYLLSRICYYRNDLDGAQTYLDRAMKDYPAMVDLQKQSMLRYQEEIASERNAGDINIFAFSQEANMVNSQLEQELMTNRVLPEDLAPPAGYFFHQGNIGIKTNNFQLAHDSFQKALLKDPAHADAANNLLAVYLLYQKAPEAQNLLETMKKRHLPVQAELERRVGEMIGTSGNPPRKP